MTYLCPRCGGTMVCISTASIPPIVSYVCYECGYESKKVSKNIEQKILPEYLWKAQWNKEEEEIKF